MKGALSAGVLPTVLRDLHVGRSSGRLRLTSADHALDALFREGRLMRVLAGGRPLTDSARARDAILASADWQRAEYGFDESAPVPAVADVDLAVGDLVLDLVRRIEDPDVVRFALGKIDRVLGVAEDAKLRTQKLALSPVDGFLLSRVDGTLSAREVVELAPVPSEQAERSLLGLLCTGAIGYLDRPEKRRSGRHKTIRSQRPTPPPIRRPTQSFRPAKPPTQEPPRETEQDASVRLRRQEIQHAFSTLKTRTVYEVLGIERTASAAQVKDSYFRAARRFHPDAHRDPALADIASQAEAVFLRIGEAYETLRDARARAAYDARLPPATSSGLRAVAPPPKAEPAAANPEPTAAPAEAAPGIPETLKTAERLLGEGQAWDAIRRLEPLQASARGAELARVLRLLGRAYRRSPESVRKAEETLTRATDADPRSHEAWMELGDFYESRGMPSRAAAMYRKALAVKPDHAEAAARLQRLEPPPPEPPPAAGGLLGKLLRRG